MQKVVLFLVVISLLKSVTSLEADFNCPDEIAAGEEFTCNIQAVENEGVYDVKVDIQKEGKTVAKVWSPSEDKWKSAYYYLKEFLEEDEAEIKITVSEPGDYTGVLKLRQGEKVESFSFELEVTGEDSEEDQEEETQEELEEDEEKEQSAESKENIVELSSKNNSLEQKPKVLSLNKLPEKSTSEEEVVYQSNSSKVLDYLPYAFSVFLIVIIFILLWEKF